MPWFVGDFSDVPDTVISSGCGIDGNGNVACDPEAMRAAAEAQMATLGYGGDLSLEGYTLARYMQSEVGSRSITERVAVGEAAVNRANLEGLGSVNDLLLYRQGPGHPNYGHYGPIHGSGFSAPYGRWAATSADPTLQTLLIAKLVADGDSGDFSNGADDQDGLEYQQAFPDPAAKVRIEAARGNYWVGPLPGVDHWHTFLWRHWGFGPDTEEGAALLAAGLAAVADRSRPDWSGLPICPKPASSRLLYVLGALGLLGGAYLASKGYRLWSKSAV